MGMLIAFIVVLFWLGHLVYLLSPWSPDPVSISGAPHLLLQAYLYTGLFITAHDAMHGTVSPSKMVNRIVGTAASLLFAGLSYKKLKKNHFAHHMYPGSEKDPDYCVKSQNFIVWWGCFMFRYASIWQIIFMGAAYNILNIWAPEIKLWFYWIIPALLGSFQLFYFGTYRPHRKPHTPEMGIHRARTLKKNHFAAMLSCYFFGYHLEHHEKPGVPWWKLYAEKKPNSEL